MTDDSTDRLGLPLLHAGQAQKEITHNEALVLLDMIVAAAVVAVGTLVPPVDPVPGECWIVGSGASGAWAGNDGSLAGWTANGWRCAAPREGMRAWSIADASEVVYCGGIWVVGEVTGAALRIDGQQVVGPREPAIDGPAGGETIDLQARVAVDNVLAALRAHGLIATA
ncbi:DUF2793 domain-containing protein [Sphingomonas qomolangmaensis]|uniref:DUF2793 domain-containing protein n=1 Tax=Sphingomonas qomolangmaensis TaxID=2918765 RepID=A0ABY5L853_9SPHN|nr:DUF2793 domain-containing protein [Sphingomonas qomolangmaensis]UUL82121.1 DUF2793 domain-containing protein [Sphingomonas qomolangmaensis]